MKADGVSMLGIAGLLDTLPLPLVVRLVFGGLREGSALEQLCSGGALPATVVGEPGAYFLVNCRRKCFFAWTRNGNWCR